jgi:anti-anti-sigma factor
MQREFSVEVDRVDGTAVVALIGEADLATVPDFAVHLWRAVDAGEPRILVDLCKTRFIDSKMVELLMQAANRVRLADGRIAISAGTDNILQVLELCGVSRVVEVRDTREAALAALAA